MSVCLPITVAEIMLHLPISIRPDVTLGVALLIMQQRNMSSLVIEPIRPGEQYSLLTLRDLHYRLSHGDSSTETMTVRELLKQPTLLVAPAMRIEDCAELLLAACVRCALVIQQSKPVGIINDRDIYQAIELRG